MSLQVKCDYEKCNTLLEKDAVNKIVGFLTLEANGRYTTEKYHFCSWECLANSELLNNNGCNGHAGNCPAGNNGVTGTQNNQPLLGIPRWEEKSIVEAPQVDIKVNENNQNSVSTQQMLTERQHAVLRLLAEGYTNAQIASRIGYSESTVHMETLTIYRFLNVHSRKEAADVAKRNGLLQSVELQEAS